MKKIKTFFIRPFVKTTLLLSGITSIVFGFLMILNVMNPFQLILISDDNWEVKTIIIFILSGIILIILPFIGFTKLLSIPFSIIIILISIYFILSLSEAAILEKLYLVPYCISLGSAVIWIFF